MSKPVKVGGHVDKIDMNFNTAADTAEAQVVAKDVPQSEKPLEFKHEGNLVYTVKDGVYRFYDATGKPLTDGEVDKLAQAYQEFPDNDPQGREKDGPVLKFPVDANGKQPGQNGFDGNVVMTGYKQKYKGEDGSTNTLDHTIFTKHENIIQVLRGKIGHDVQVPAEMEKVKEGEKVIGEQEKK